MNEVIEIKELLDRYYEGESSDADEQRLREYFTLGNVATELQPYRSIFACLQHERESTGAVISMQLLENQKSKIKNFAKRWRYAAAAVAACLLIASILVHEYPSASKNECTGTYVVINGICYNDIALVKKYATETIDMVTQPFGDGSATKALDFLNESITNNQ